MAVLGPLGLSPPAVYLPEEEKGRLQEEEEELHVTHVVPGDVTDDVA